MSILIKGMEMPERMDLLRFNTDILGHMQATNVNEEEGWFEVVEIPPHGRLIDADKLLKEAKRLSGPMTGDGWDNWGVYALIERQPTVIEAEE